MATRYQLLSDGDYFSRQYIVEFITSMSRCFSPLAQAICLALFKSCKVWHNDESTMKVLELLQKKYVTRRSKNYIWCLVTGSHEKNQGVVYLGSKTRSLENS
ncbi:MAG: transposase [Succinivibrio dextrinosolvens]|nr:transposase [Succinivibrio dextrinosolvens]